MGIDDDEDDKVEHLLVKFSYRPCNKDKQSHETPYKLAAVVSQSTVLVLLGNFNLLDVCWKYSTSERKQRLLECVKDSFLTGK